MADLFRRLASFAEEFRWKDAASPSWWVNFVRRQLRLYTYIARETVKDRCLHRAAALTFTTLLSLVPLFVVAFSFFRGFQGFQGLEKRAQRAIFETLLAAPLMETGVGPTDWHAEEESFPPLPGEGTPPEELLDQADQMRRRSEAWRAARLYLEALRRGGAPNAVRSGLSSLYFGPQKSLERCFSDLNAELRTTYGEAVDLPASAEEPKPWKGYRHYVKASSLRDTLDYEPALDELKKAESHGYSISKTRLLMAEVHAGLARERRSADAYEEAANHFRTAARLTTDGLILGKGPAREEAARRLIEEHNEALRQLGQTFLALGERKLQLHEKMKTRGDRASAEVLEEAIDHLEEASRCMENSPEAHASLAEALWQKGEQEQARKHYQLAAQSSRTGAVRGFSVAVADYMRQLIERGSGAGLGVLGILFLIVTATSLLSTIENTLNGIWQVSEKRPFWIKFTAFCTLIWLGPAMIAAGIIIQEELGQKAAQTFLGVPGLEALFRLTATMGRYVLPLLTVWLVLVAIYKFLPHTTVRLGAACWGAFVGAVLIQIARPGFGLYVSHAIRYEKLYGSLGAFPIFLLWIWLLWVLVLFGAEVAFTVQNVGLLHFRERMHHLSGLLIDRYLAVRIMMYVAREFWRNGQPMPVDKLSDTLEIPPEEAANAASSLVKVGLLTPVGEERDKFHPARDLSRLSVMEVLNITDRFRAESRSPRPKDHPWEETLEEVFNASFDAQEQALDGMTFRDLMVRCEEAEKKSEETKRDAEH